MSDQEIKYVRLCSEAPKGSGVVHRGDVVPKKAGEEWVRENTLNNRNVRFWVEDVITNPKSWFEKSAEIEGDSEVGAGIPPGKEFFQLECGTWVWRPDKTRGAFCAENLRKIADKLDGLNNEN